MRVRHHPPNTYAQCPNCGRESLFNDGDAVWCVYYQSPAEAGDERRCEYRQSHEDPELNRVLDEEEAGGD